MLNIIEVFARYRSYQRSLSIGDPSTIAMLVTLVSSSFLDLIGGYGFTGLLNYIAHKSYIPGKPAELWKGIIAPILATCITALGTGFLIRKVIISYQERLYKVSKLHDITKSILGMGKPLLPSKFGLNNNIIIDKILENFAIDIYEYQDEAYKTSLYSLTPIQMKRLLLNSLVYYYTTPNSKNRMRLATDVINPYIIELYKKLVFSDSVTESLKALIKNINGTRDEIYDKMLNLGDQDNKLNIYKAILLDLVNSDVNKDCYIAHLNKHLNTKEFITNPQLHALTKDLNTIENGFKVKAPKNNDIFPRDVWINIVSFLPESLSLHTQFIDKDGKNMLEMHETHLTKLLKQEEEGSKVGAGQVVGLIG